ncbi:MAG: replication-associated recombination protein A [Candidatus Moraniibacteriota bacterium]|jgi:putative ATPase
MNINKPLAERVRPQTISDFYGQEQLIGDGQILRTMIDNDKISSMILWGPPGTGKTTLARIIASETSAHFVQLSAINAGVKDVRAAIADAESYARLGTRSILFIDEVHRFNKAQQDAFLPSVEDGTIIFIGATTENPSFEVNSALLSRARVFVLKSLEKGDIVQIVDNTLKNSQENLGVQKIKIKKNVKEYLALMSNGDARTALNALEVAVEFANSENEEDSCTVLKKHIEQALQNSNLLYDKNGEEHYNLISALHKSMRGGDADASIYYLARMLKGGEDPLYLARRIVRFASEDIGLANSFALPQAVAAYDACRFIGMPECGVNLAQAVVYMAKSKKSISVYEGYKSALDDVNDLGNLPVPLHLRNAPTKMMKDLDYGKDYKYTPMSTKEENETQQFLPDKIKDKKYIK